MQVVGHMEGVWQRQMAIRQIEKVGQRQIQVVNLELR